MRRRTLEVSLTRSVAGDSSRLMDEETQMTRARRKRGPSLLRRLIYFAIVLSGGGAGGYAFQNNSLVRSLLNVVTGQPADKVLATLDDSLVKDVVNVIKPADATGAPGLYEVAITKVELDQKLFRPGHTVDIQARVRRLGPAGRSSSRPGGLPSTPPVRPRPNFRSSRATSGWFRPRAPMDRSIRAPTTSSCGASVSVVSAPPTAQRPRSPSAPSSSNRPARARGEQGVSTRLSIDRFEGKGKPIAVLLTDDGDALNFPRSLLPAGAKPGDVLTLTLERDAAASRQVADETRQVQDKLAERDPAGDIKL
jgi:hypothetical protein